MGKTHGRAVTAQAPAKITVCFRVGSGAGEGDRAVASLYQSVSLWEEVTAQDAPGFSISYEGPSATPDLAMGENALAIRAVRLLAEETGYEGGAALTVFRRVPVAAGIGGSSADAAAALVACDELWGTRVGRSTLAELASQLGAGVRFALDGGTAVGTERADELSPALAQGTFHWVLACLRDELSVPEVYLTLDRHREEHRANLAPAPESVSVDTEVLQAVRAGDARTLADTMQNDLQPAAMRMQPSLGRLLELGESRGALAGIVSGSGPTIAFLAEDAASASSLQAVLTREGVRSLTVVGPVSGAKCLDKR